MSILRQNVPMLRFKNTGDLSLIFLFVIADFTTSGESLWYGLPLPLCRLLGPLGPFFVL